jgi:Carboxypeptidase regulatory-like domain
MPAKPIVVAGVVRGPRGEQLTQARVFIARGPVPVPDIAALTDADGRFILSLPAPGTYELACVAEGYAPSSATIEVADQQELGLELRLPLERPGR